MEYKQEVIVEQSFEKVVSNFNQSLFEFLAPTFPKLTVQRFDGIKTGDLVQLKISTGLNSLQWNGEITHHELTDDKLYFIDIGTLLPFPFKTWKHHHIVEKVSEKETKIIDRVEFTPVSNWLKPVSKVAVNQMLSPRIKLYKQYFKNC